MTTYQLGIGGRYVTEEEYRAESTSTTPDGEDEFYAECRVLSGVEA